MRNITGTNARSRCLAYRIKTAWNADLLVIHMTLATNIVSALPLCALLTFTGCGSASEAPHELGGPGQQIERYLSDRGITGETTTSTGLIYRIEEPGGDEHPTVDSEVTIHYTGQLVDGHVFDETEGEPRTFSLRQLIPAWQEGIPLIGRGGKITLLAPPNLAYGSNPPPGTGIASESVLVFEVELVDFE